MIDHRNRLARALWTALPVVALGCGHAGSGKAAAANPFTLAPGEGRVLALPPGGAYTVKLGAEQTHGELEIFELVAEPGGAMPAHVHALQDEAAYVLSGRFKVLIAERVADLAPGSFLFIPRGTPHTYVNSGSSRGTVIAIGTPGGLERLMSELGDAMSKLPPGPPDVAVLASVLQKHDVTVVGPPLSP